MLMGNGMRRVSTPCAHNARDLRGVAMCSNLLSKLMSKKEELPSTSEMFLPWVRQGLCIDAKDKFQVEIG